MLTWIRQFRRKSSQPQNGKFIQNPSLGQNQLLNDKLAETLQWLEDSLGRSDDFVIRRFRIFGRFSAAIAYFSSLCDQKIIDRDIIRPLLSHQPDEEQLALETLPDLLWNDYVYMSSGTKESRPDRLIQSLMNGSTILMMDGYAEAFLFETRNQEKRSIDQPQTEQVIRGARDGFIESLETNLSLVRSRLQAPDLRVKTIVLGRRTNTKAAICYIEGIANPALVEEVNSRVSKIDTGEILDSGYIEQFIEDHPMSPFPQIQNTERPDVVVASLLEGRIAILTAGSPFALVVPVMFSQFYQTPDDYTERFLVASLIRFVRLIAILLSLVFPSLYVSVISFNPELLPTDFAVAVAGGRAGVPFPAVLEVLFIDIAMEVLREATIRMPQMIGGAISIVGVLVIGQAAVSAGFASPITVVIIALSTIGSFAVPAYNAAISLRMLRFPLTILAGIFGLYGVMVGMIIIVNHLLFIESFGVPYLVPFVPGNRQGAKDSLVRAPLWWMSKRPSHLHVIDETRLPSDSAKPSTSPVMSRPAVKEEKSGEDKSQNYDK